MRELDVCPDCDTEFPGEITHMRCPGCGAKVHPSKEPTPLYRDGFLEDKGLDRELN